MAEQEHSQSFFLEEAARDLSIVSSRQSTEHLRVLFDDMTSAIEDPRRIGTIDADDAIPASRRERLR